ncbi:nicotinate-nucleotide adenylyltransferase [Arenimonas sp.]|uniref:nicotinate-nucleotide adenylyltransferase n=1 Tax=Arenimonas sp. TaxID=1872635 RepID=UPI0039E4766D
MLRLFYGGTFDPVHNGHLAVAAAAHAELSADVVLLPAADPPHRPPTGASAAQRSQMLRLAVQALPYCRVDERELRRAGPSYSVDTLKEIRREIGPDQPLAWLLGADSFRSLASWHHWRELFGLAHFVVAIRPGHDIDRLAEPLHSACSGRWTEQAQALAATAAGRLYRLVLPPRPESATAVRRSFATGEGDLGWLPPAVAAYVREQGLYRSQGI